MRETGYYALTRVVDGEKFTIDFSRIVAREGELAHAIEVFRQELGRLKAFAAAKGETAELQLERWYPDTDEDEWKHETVAHARTAMY